MTNVESRSSPAARPAVIALVLLTALNLVNYIDRYILPGVQELVKNEFRVSDQQIGSLTMWFFLTYIAAAPLTGWLGDVFPRKPLIVIGAVLWSGVNLLTASVHSYEALLVRHAALGIGEASFGIFGPAVLADFYAPAQRNRVLTIFNIAIPVGAALGFTLGGFVGQAHGWRTAFYVSGIPGLVMAGLILVWMKEPQRGGAHGMDPGLNQDATSEAAKSRRDGLDRGRKPSAQDGQGGMGSGRFQIWRAEVSALFRNPGYVFGVLGYAMSTFTIGGISWWMSSFLQRMDGMSTARAGFTVGAITAVTGLLGTAAGGWWAQRWLRTNRRALYYVSASASSLCIPFALLCFFGPRSTLLPALAVAEFCLFLGSGPINAAIVNAVSARVRATALAGQLLFIHLLGDVPSPRIIGAVSDHSNLRFGLGVTVIALVASAGFLLIGSRFAGRTFEPA